MAFGDIKLTFQASNNVERGNVVLEGSTLFVHPYDLILQENFGTLPLYTRHTLGAIEAERDRRRHA